MSRLSNPHASPDASPSLKRRCGSSKTEKPRTPKTPSTRTSSPRTGQDCGRGRCSKIVSCLPCISIMAALWPRAQAPRHPALPYPFTRSHSPARPPPRAPPPVSLAASTMRQPSTTARVPTAKRAVFSGRRSMLESTRSQDRVQLTRLLVSASASTSSSITFSAATDVLHSQIHTL
jgi:hypothetical protein